jgi:hypothetical protein
MTIILMQIVYIFAQEIRMFSFIGPFMQSFSEARGAAVSVFRLIDEVNLSELTSCINFSLVCCLSHIGTRHKCE